MDNKKNDTYYLEKILQHIDFIINNTKELHIDDIKTNELLIDSIMFRLIQISENCDRLSNEFKDRFPLLPYRFMKGIRNIIVHDYGIVDINIVYSTITKSIPELKDNLYQIYTTIGVWSFRKNYTSRII